MKVKSRMMSGSKELRGVTARKRNNEKATNNDVTFIVLQKNMRSMHPSERIEELVCELEGYRRNAFLLCETWRHDKHIFMGAGKYDNKHGVGILLNKKWKQRTIDTEYINERAISTAILVNRQRIKLMSVYFSHSGYADHHIEKMYRTIEEHTENCISYIPIIGGDFNAELGLGHGNECISVGRYTLNEGNKRGDWMKHWLVLQGYTALNKMCRETPQKRTTYRSPKGNEKQIDHILTKRRHPRHAKDAEANDMRPQYFHDQHA